VVSTGATLDDLKEAVSLVVEGKVQTMVDSTIPFVNFKNVLDRSKNCS